MHTVEMTRCLERPSDPSSLTLSLVRSWLVRSSLSTGSPFQNKMQLKRLGVVRNRNWPKCVDHVDILTCSRPGHPRTSASTCHIARNLRRLPYLRTVNRTVALRRDQVRVMLPCKSTCYFEWTQNHRIRIVPYHLCYAARPLGFACNKDDLCLCYDYR